MKFCPTTAALLVAITSLLHGSSATSADDLESIRTKGELVWGADQEGGGPFIFPSPADPNTLIGFEVELAELIASHLGVKARFQQGQWDKLPDLLDRGDIDLVLNGFEWNENRAQRYGTSIPYYIYELQLLVEAKNTSIQSWDDLLKATEGDKPRVSLLGGAAAEDYTTAFAGDKVELALFDGVTDAMRATEMGSDGIVANVQDLPIWNFYQKDFPGLRPVGAPVGRGFYVAMTRKGDVELLKAVNEALFEGLKNGKLRAIFERYGMWNDTQALRGLELTADGGFSGRMPSETAEKPPEASSQSLSGLSVILDRGWFLIRAALMTVLLSSTAMPLAIAVGLMMALLRLYGPKYLSIPATVYVELVRGTPLVLQLYVIYFLVPEILKALIPGSHFTITAFWSAVVGLAVNYSAYEAEIYRAGLQAIPRGQMEAALSLGMTQRQALRRIIVPQATRLVIPPVTNDFIALFKDTAVCSVITVVELSKEYYIQARNTGAIVELGLLTALLYLAMSYPLSLLAGRLEKRLGTNSGHK
ncbi:MAG: ABC transporter permease subunit [Planctomycetaceae bacterium]|nr:ABC transporter permease subunit [Planctomycetaceae bacterium]